MSPTPFRPRGGARDHAPGDLDCPACRLAALPDPEAERSYPKRCSCGGVIHHDDGGAEAVDADFVGSIECDRCGQEFKYRDPLLLDLPWRPAPPAQRRGHMMMSSRDDPSGSDDLRARFEAILDRMQLLRGDFTAQAEDRDDMHALADAPEDLPGPAGDVLPDEYCVQLELPSGSTYRAAARRLIEVLRGG